MYCDASSDGAEFFPSNLPAYYDNLLARIQAFMRHISSYHQALKKLKKGNRVIKTVPDAANHGFLDLGEFQ